MTVSSTMARAAKAVTTSVPIVMGTGVDPVGEGLVQSLARPGGNITGLTISVSPEIEVKRVELPEGRPAPNHSRGLPRHEGGLGSPIGEERAGGRADPRRDADPGRTHFQ